MEMEMEPRCLGSYFDDSWLRLKERKRGGGGGGEKKRWE